MWPHAGRVLLAVCAKPCWGNSAGQHDSVKLPETPPPSSQSPLFLTRCYLTLWKGLLALGRLRPQPAQDQSTKDRHLSSPVVAHHPLDLPCGPKRTSFAEANLTQLGSTDSVRGWEVDHPKAANTRKGNWLHTARLLVVSGHCQHKTRS